MAGTHVAGRVPAISYQPKDYASNLVPAGRVFCRQMPPRTTISYWYKMVEKIGTRYFGCVMSQTRNTHEEKRHVFISLVKLIRAQNDHHCSYPDQQICRTKQSIVFLDVVAANKQAPILMHLAYLVKLPDHDFAVASGHKLTPSVYAGIEIKENGLRRTEANEFERLVDLPKFKSLLKTGEDKSVKPVLVFTVREALSWVHDEPTAAHLGQTKSLERARQRFYVPKMDRAVTRCIQSCKGCQTRKPDQGKKKGLMEITQAGGFFERIGIDVLGPFPRSRNGNTNIVVAVDYLTKWVEARALPDATARQIAKFFVEDVVIKHGFSRELTSDQGKCFTAEVTREVLALLRLSHRMTVPYHQQAVDGKAVERWNGLVERQNKTLATMLAMYVDESHEDWDEFLGFVTFAYNTARQESTNHTPFMMVYGREAVIPVDLLASTGPSQPKLVGAVDLMKAMMELREDVKDRLAMVQQRQKTQYDARVSAAPVYEPGDLVLIFRPQRKKGLAEKLMHQYVGPYKVIRQKFVVESDEESDSDEEVEKLEHADTDLDVERTDTDLDVERADNGSEEALAETEEGMACAETDTGEMPEADTGVTSDTSTAAAAVEPPARREKGRIRRRSLNPIAEMDEGLQDGKDSAVPAATESPAGRPTRGRNLNTVLLLSQKST
ncbi:Uncharacterized protein APZ42_030414 [Daphnia magna]|uniref:RNA-directed DNA polymerase n=1 Tax=Daphnia magna TaxID=35525 RepID=A0A164NTQ3_9CRUS|nr:Uncharacterized protein APZ42_030414 [Daphnia magna]